MTARLFVTVTWTLALTGGVLLAGSAPAGACSCVAPLPTPTIAFTGTAVEAVEPGHAPPWRFRTDAVLKGRVEPEPLVRIQAPVELPDGTTASSSCDILVALIPGRRYRVEPISYVTNGVEQLSINACGGSIRPILAAVPASPADEPASPTAEAGPTSSGGRTLRLVAALAVSGLVAAAVIGLARRRRGSGTRQVES